MTPGQAAYAVFRNKVHIVATSNSAVFLDIAAYLDTVVPEWQHMPDEGKALWDAIAQAVIDNALECDKRGH